MRGLIASPVLCMALVIAGCGGGGNTTIINNNQTTVTTSTPSSTAPATTSTTATTPPATGPGPEPSKPEPEPKADADGALRCSDAGVITGGTPASSGAAASPGFTNLTARGVSCAVALSVAAAWVKEFDSSCAAGCVRRVGEVRCRYAGSGSSVGCFAAKTELSFELAYPDS